MSINHNVATQKGAKREMRMHEMEDEHDGQADMRGTKNHYPSCYSLQQKIALVLTELHDQDALGVGAKVSKC